MRVNRVYYPQPMESGQRIELDADTTHHLINVLRMQPAQTLVLFDGSGTEYNAVIESASKKSACVLIEASRNRDTQSSLYTTLAIALSRNDRVDTAIQKCTELGVDTIALVQCDRSQSKLSADRIPKKMRHWQQIAVSASEQSGRTVLPEIIAPKSLEDFLASQESTQKDKTLKLLLAPEGAEARLPASGVEATCVLTGPEGGFSNQEIELAVQAGFVGVNFGPRILRAETAPIAALSVLQSKYGDLPG